MGGTDVGHPVAHCFVDSLLEGGLSRGHPHDLGAQKAHPRHVERLAFHVHRAHIDDAFHPRACAHRGGGNAMLAGTGLGDDPALAHPAREKNLPQGVVDLVGPGVKEILAFEVDFGTAQFAGEALSKVKRRGASGEVLEGVCEFVLERLVLAGRRVFVRKRVERVHERFGHKHSTIGAEVAVLIRERLEVYHATNVGRESPACQRKPPCGVGRCCVQMGGCADEGSGYASGPMDFQDRIDADIKEAMKAKQAMRLGVLRMLKSALKNAAIEQGGADVRLQEEAAQAVLRKEAKKRQDSIEGFQKGGRPELADKEREELAVLADYLPKPLSAPELDTLVGEVIAALGATSKAAMGQVMKLATEKAAGRVDGRSLSAAVSARLQ